MRLNSSSILIFFAIFWSAITLLFDGLVFVTATRQIVALNFPTTEGTISSSQVTHNDDSEGGPTHGVSVRYTYSVEGKEYTGTRYRYDHSTSSDSAWAYAAVAARSPGTRVQVFYNPHNPQDSVLATGLAGSDLFMIAFMTPFNAIMLAFWWAGWAHLRRKWFKPVGGGVRIITGLRTTRVRLTAWSPFGATSATMALLAFLSIFPIAFLGGGFHPSMRVMIVAWSVILCGSVAVGVWQGMKVLAGKYDLILDEFNGTLELPATEGRKSRRKVRLSDIDCMYVETIQKSSKNGDESSPMYAPSIRIEGGTAGTERLVQWFEQEKSAQFVTWLREKLPQRSGPSRPLAGKF